MRDANRLNVEVRAYERVITDLQLLLDKLGGDTYLEERIFKLQSKYADLLVLQLDAKDCAKITVDLEKED